MLQDKLALQQRNRCSFLCRFFSFSILSRFAIQMYTENMKKEKNKINNIENKREKKMQKRSNNTIWNA